MSIGQTSERNSDPPRIVESDAVSFLDHTELTVLDASGPYTCCDVWMSVPENWSASVVIRVYARLGAITTLVHTVKVGDVPAINREGTIQGLALMVRGRPCTGFEVTAQASGVLGDFPYPTGEGSFAMQVWGAEGGFSASGGAPFDTDLGPAPLPPVRAEGQVALLAAKTASFGGVTDRFELLEAGENGLKVQLAGSPAVTGVVEGQGVGGEPSGGVLTVQGPDGGVLTVQGTDGGILTVQTTGTTTVTGAVNVSGSVGVSGSVSVSGGSVGVGGTVTSHQGSPTTASNRWPTYLSDGSSAHGVVANPLFTRLSNGSAAVGALSAPLGVQISDGSASQGVVGNPLYAKLSDGANPNGVLTNPLYSRLTDGSSAQGVVSNPLYAKLSDGANPNGVVGNPLYSRLSDGSAAQGVVGNPMFARLSNGTSAIGVLSAPVGVQMSDGAAAQGVVGNPMFARLSNGSSAIGTAATPLGVQLSNGSSAIGTAAAPVGVQLSNGSSSVGTLSAPVGIQLSDGSAAFGTSSNPVNQRLARDRVGYLATSTSITGPTTGNTVILGNLWNPNSGSKRVEIERIVVSCAGTQTGTISIRGARLSADDSGGTSTSNVVKVDSSDGSNAATARTAPTSASGRSSVEAFCVLLKTADHVIWSWDAGLLAKPIILRPTGEGFEVRAVAEGTVATGVPLTVTFYWVEI